MCIQPAAKCAVSPEEDEQVVAEDGRRHHQRQGEQSVEQCAPRKTAAREQVARDNTTGEADEGGTDGNFEREQERGEDRVHGGCCW